jgi:hypothetical protein
MFFVKHKIDIVKAFVRFFGSSSRFHGFLGQDPKKAGIQRLFAVAVAQSANAAGLQFLVRAMGSTQVIRILYREGLVTRFLDFVTALCYKRRSTVIVYGPHFQQ